MKLTLREQESAHLPTLKPLDRDGKHSVEITTKFDTLTYAEADNNVVSFLVYLNDVQKAIDNIQEGIGSLGVVSELDIYETKQKLIEFNEKLEEFKDLLEVANNTFNDITETIRDIDRNVPRQFKTLNGQSILGAGNINTGNIVEQLTARTFGMIGTQSVFEVSVPLIINKTYTGTDLFYDEDKNPVGTWRCMGKIINDIGLFLRIL